MTPQLLHYAQTAKLFKILHRQKNSNNPVLLPNKNRLTLRYVESCSEAFLEICCRHYFHNKPMSQLINGRIIAQRRQFIHFYVLRLVFNSTTPFPNQQHIVKL